MSDWMESGKAAARDDRPQQQAPVLSGAAQPAKPPPTPVLVAMNSVRPSPVSWLWTHWLPLGTLAVLDGDPGLGKSTLTLDLTARITQGWEMPPEGGGCSEEPAAVLLLSAEDDPEQTIRPRLDAANADPSRVHFFQSITEGQGDGKRERPPVLPWDLDLVEDRIKETGTVLVIVDPFSAFLGSEFDAHKDQDIRRCLHQLALLAHRSRVTILLVRHLNKLSGGPALYRGGGSIAITGAARAAMVVGRDPDEPTRHVLAMNKSNLGPHPRSLAYRIEQAGPDVTRIEWEGETDLLPADILWHAQGRSPGRPDDQVTEAEEFLATALANGPVAVTKLEKDAKAAGMSWRTVQRAKSNLKVFSRKILDCWVWKLP
jgi:hypothetical protein